MSHDITTHRSIFPTARASLVPSIFSHPGRWEFLESAAKVCSERSITWLMRGHLPLKAQMQSSPVSTISLRCVGLARSMLICPVITVLAKIRIGLCWDTWHGVSWREDISPSPSTTCHQDTQNLHRTGALVSWKQVPEVWDPLSGGFARRCAVEQCSEESQCATDHCDRKWRCCHDLLWLAGVLPATFPYPRGHQEDRLLLLHRQAWDCFLPRNSGRWGDRIFSCVGCVFCAEWSARCYPTTRPFAWGKAILVQSH